MDERDVGAADHFHPGRGVEQRQQRNLRYQIRSYP
jgi:hypothetical protein